MKHWAIKKTPRRLSFCAYAFVCKGGMLDAVTHLDTNLEEEKKKEKRKLRERQTKGDVTWRTAEEGSRTLKGNHSVASSSSTTPTASGRNSPSKESSLLLEGPRRVTRQ